MAVGRTTQEQLSSNSPLLRGILTPPWNEEDVQLYLNLNRYGYMFAFSAIFKHHSSNSKPLHPVVLSLFPNEA